MSSTLLAPTPDSFLAHSAPIKMIRISESGRFVATGDTDVQIKIWVDRQEVATIDPRSEDDKIRPTENIRDIAFSGDERHLYVSATETLKAYSTETGMLEWEYRAPRHFGFLIVSPLAIAVAQDGRIAASFDYGSMAMFSPEGHLLWRRNENYAPRYMSFTTQGEDLVGAESFNLCLWDASTGRTLERSKLDHKIYAMACLPSEGMVVTRELYTLSLYQAAPLQKEFEIPAGRGLPTVAVNRFNNLIASGEKNRIRLVNLEGQGVRDIHVPDVDVISLAFTGDGNQVIAGCSDGSLRHWDVDTSAR